jgi:hypothetical protein
VADAGYSNGAQAEACEAKGILPHVPANRGVNNQGDGTLFDRSEFIYQPESDTFLCPAGQQLARQTIIAERSCGVLRRVTRRVRKLRAEIAMHNGLPAFSLTASARRGSATHATASHAGSHAATTIDGGASVCQPQIPHLRTSTLPAAWSAGSTNGNQPGRSLLTISKG